MEVETNMLSDLNQEDTNKDFEEKSYFTVTDGFSFSLNPKKNTHISFFWMIKPSIRLGW